MTPFTVVLNTPCCQRLYDRTGRSVSEMPLFPSHVQLSARGLSFHHLLSHDLFQETCPGSCLDWQPLPPHQQDTQ